MTSLVAMLFEKMVSHCPIGINPFISIMLALALAFAPHILRKPLLAKKLEEANKKFDIANSRLLTKESMDDSPLGIKLAWYVGCHQNGLEALMYFSAALLSAIVAQVEKDTVQKAAAIFLAWRIAYTALYLRGHEGPLRFLTWLAGLSVCLGLLWSSFERCAVWDY